MKTITKILFSILLIYISLKKINLPELMYQVKSINLSFILINLPILIIINIVAAIRWQITLHSLGSFISIINSIKITFLGQFFNQILPSSVGGDLIRIWSAHKLNMRGIVAISSVIVDRLLGLVILLILGGYGFMISLDKNNETNVVLTIMGGILLISAYLVSYFYLIRPYQERLQRIKFLKKVLEINDYVLLVLRDIKATFWIMICSLICHGGSVLIVYFIAFSFGYNFSLSSCFFVVSFAGLVSALPISIAGWGVRESAFIAGFSIYGISPSMAVPVSLLYGVLNLFFGLSCGLLWLFDYKSDSY